MSGAGLDPHVQRADALAAAGLRHGFFGRGGGVSEGIYAGLNCGYGSGDDRAAVRENRSRAAAWLGTDHDRLLTVHQVHSARVVRVDGPWDGKPPEADGMVTTVPGLALGVLAADCAPVLLADPAARVIGACHAGWRGAFDGIVEATVAAMAEAGADRANIRAAVGPCIRQPSYEVGPEFRERFAVLEDKGAIDGGALFRPSGRSGHWLFDLPLFVRSRLAPTAPESVGDVGQDTYPQPDRFFSYRRATHRGEPDYGRNLSAIMLEP